jgi:glycosyltransferase involved in cell wall biosynthesis
MRIAILGIRGVPANYGGFETFAEELGARLVERGHQVTVYGRDSSIPAGTREHRGIRVVRLPAPGSKYLETVVHSLFAALHAVVRRYDIVYVCNSANIPAVLLLLLARKRVVLNVDGLEWQRAKWNRIGRAYYRLCAWAAAHLPAHVVTDARVIQTYYEHAYGRKTDYFPYGTDLVEAPDDGLLAQLGLTSRGYVLFVSRLEPENNAHVVIAAYRNVDGDIPLAIVGDAPYANDYIASLRETSDARVRFVGAIYGQGYRILQSNALVYVQATEVGGTHPALVEAMGAGNAIVANDVPEHRETLEDAGLFYQGPDELASRLRELIANPERARALRIASRQRAETTYSWDAITDSYEAWFQSLLQLGRRPRTPSKGGARRGTNRPGR